MQYWFLLHWMKPIKNSINRNYHSHFKYSLHCFLVSDDQTKLIHIPRFMNMYNVHKHRVTIPCKRFFDFTWNPHEIRRISGEIHPKPYKIRCFSKNSSDFIRFGVDFTWNLLDFMKSTGFHLESARFHGEIHQISRISWWNLPDFMNVSFWVMIKYRSFYRKTKQQLLLDHRFHKVPTDCFNICSIFRHMSVYISGVLSYLHIADGKLWWADVIRRNLCCHWLYYLSYEIPFSCLRNIRYILIFPRSGPLLWTECVDIEFTLL